MAEVGGYRLVGEGQTWARFDTPCLRRTLVNRLRGRPPDVSLPIPTAPEPMLIAALGLTLSTMHSSCKRVFNDGYAGVRFSYHNALARWRCLGLCPHDCC